MEAEAPGIFALLFTILGFVILYVIIVIGSVIGVFIVLPVVVVQFLWKLITTNPELQEALPSILGLSGLSIAAVGLDFLFVIGFGILGGLAFGIFNLSKAVRKVLRKKSSP